MRTENESFVPVSDLPSAAGIVAAQHRLKPYVTPTQPYLSPALSGMLDAEIWVKVETTTPIASFKLRGALNSLLALREQGKAPAVATTASTGNHGQGVARAAQLLGIPCSIFVPTGCNEVKKAAMQRFGAEVFEGGDDIDDARDNCDAFANKTVGASIIDDGMVREVIEGAGTIGLEIAMAVPGVDYALMPMGSGALVGGAATALKSLIPHAKVFAAQSSGAPAMTMSLKARQYIEHPVNTICDCLASRRPAHLALETVIRTVDDSILVDDEDILTAIRELALDAHIIVEPGAAAGFAAAKKIREKIKGKTVVISLTGANIDSKTLGRAMQQ